MAAAPREYAANFSGFFFALAGMCEGSGALLRGSARALARDYRGLHQESRRAASHCSLPHARCVTSVLSYVELEIGKCPFPPKVAARYGPEAGVLETLSGRRRWPRRARVTTAAWRRLNVSCPSSVYQIPWLLRRASTLPTFHVIFSSGGYVRGFWRLTAFVVF